MAFVNELCDLLQTHSNRDKVANLAAYGLKFWASTTNSSELMTASARLAAARATLRLFDDAAALKVLRNYGIGKQDGPFWGMVGAANSIFTLWYLQAEKLQWLIDTGVWKADKEVEYKIRVAHKLYWSLYAFAGFLRSIRALHLASKELNSPRRRKCSSARFKHASLVTTKLLLDVVHAVSWLPKGWLWGSRLTTQQASGIATLAAIMGLIAHYQAKRLGSSR